MARRRYLIAYDIANPKRLRAVVKLMEDFGTRLQYSVFLCDLRRAELAVWRTALTDVVELKEDSVVVIDLGAVGATPIEVIGLARNLPSQGAVVV
ncbi:CRISPR-associated endonuclease Cas2 [Propionibacterium australiense]|uniref:CRISPR-associated endoribonuclease Cas2 n=1 Tax=Propionibacterium australiense TaxID=119981 RepID=A0A383S7N2_9ACTN|nr:CRISPR-associated endonuclease Cas2 [Propionibacterium australiense]RLP07629.1 CRISPR-associated endonuclease Cas2 [Propionibacterium australiense]SYZ33988.1 CRISPR-associated endoribonuclease Cas2 [cas2] [Propionibacterium australiense]VEH88965.1 CRISPR-associated endoribonuclease Cas2 [Propionibacterium australiense]